MDFEYAVYIAKTWGLLYLFILFCGALFYAFRPGAKKKFEDAAYIPLRED